MMTWGTNWKAERIAAVKRLKRAAKAAGMTPHEFSIQRLKRLHQTIRERATAKRENP